MVKALLLMFGISLGLTLIIEISLALLFGIKGKSLIAVALVNVLTNPLIVYLCWVFDWHFPVQIIPELVVVLVEGGIYYLFDKFAEGYEIRKPFLKALVFNAVSYGIGLVINLVSKI